jgi:hypothetical protein
MASILNNILCQIGTKLYDEMNRTVVPLLESKIEAIFSKLLDNINKPDSELLLKLKENVKNQLKQKLDSICEKMEIKIGGSGDGDGQDAVSRVTSNTTFRHNNIRSRRKRKTHRRVHFPKSFPNIMQNVQ